jgi:hypothetical protein
MTAKHVVLRAMYVMGLMAGMSLTWVVNVSGHAIHPPIGTPLPDPPQVFSPFELRAINDPATGKGAFVFEGHEVPPVIRAVPEGQFRWNTSTRCLSVLPKSACTGLVRT